MILEKGTKRPGKRLAVVKRVAVVFSASSVHSIAPKSAWILVLVLAMSVAPASAEIFRCVAKNGGDRYQNFPCDIDSLGPLPSNPRVTKAPPPAADARASAAPVIASTAKSANASGPEIGMTADEVRAIWGEPIEITQDEPRAGRIEIWRYADGRSVQINNKQRVSAVQR
jgi:hypothetical protein